MVDPIDNQLKHALGDRPNSEFVIDPRGKIVRKRSWSDPRAARKDLEELVGKVDRITRPEDLKLKVIAPPRVAARGVVPWVKVGRMRPLKFEPEMKKGGKPFYVKLRPETDSGVLSGRAGKLYLGFHLDPIYHGHWNNLVAPLRYQLELPEGVKMKPTSGAGPKVAVPSDIDPREFLIEVERWPADKAIQVTVFYSVCIDKGCLAIKQQYTLHRRSDRDGGAARRGGFGRRNIAEMMVRRLMSYDKNGDGKLSKKEAPARMQRMFNRMDANNDGTLDKNEIEQIAEHMRRRRRRE